MKKGTSKKRREKKPKKEKKKNISGEKSEIESKMDKCSMGHKNPPLRNRKKGIKKERRIMDMCPRVSRAHFSKLISEKVIMDACPRVSRTQLSTK
jgi:hypothetical protein